MKNILSQMLRDKNGQYSLRECTILVLLMIVVVSWVAQQFFGLAVPEFMFYSFTSLIAAGCFGYSIERRSPLVDPSNANNSTNP